MSLPGLAGRLRGALRERTTRRVDIQGYIDERSTRHVKGWARDLADIAARVPIEVVLPGNADQVDRLGAAVADDFSTTLEMLGIGDGRHAFLIQFPRELTPAERDMVQVRAAGTFALPLAPGIWTGPPGTRPLIAGFVDELSTHHARGWLWNEADDTARVDYVVELRDNDGPPRVLAAGRADLFSQHLVNIGVGDGAHGFSVFFSPPLTEAERDRVEIRATESGMKVALAPALSRAFEPIGHVALDLVDNCNLRCPFCVYDYSETKRTHFMSAAIFESALRLIPYTTEGNFWLSCFHEATLHPDLLRFIDCVPIDQRRKLMYTTNLAKPMPDSYFAAIAASGMHHLNISLESLDPVLYERMRKGARFRIFLENWQRLLAAVRAGSASPRLRYNVLAYRSNRDEIPALVETLLTKKLAWQVEIRHTFDEEHIPRDFAAAEYLDQGDWEWLAEQLSGYAPERVLLIPPSRLKLIPPPPSSSPETTTKQKQHDQMAKVSHGPPHPLQIRIDWDGKLRVYGETQGTVDGAPTLQNFVISNIAYIRDVVGFVTSL